MFCFLKFEYQLNISEFGFTSYRFRGSLLAQLMKDFHDIKPCLAGTDMDDVSLSDVFSYVWQGHLQSLGGGE